MSGVGIFRLFLPLVLIKARASLEAAASGRDPPPGGGTHEEAGQRKRLKKSGLLPTRVFLALFFAEAECEGWRKC